MGDNAVKKIIKIIVPLILMLVCVTGAFAQGTLSEEILNQAKREAGLFLELKSALGLDWLDEYNAYLENPTDNPEPSWDLSVADLVSGGYLSDSFPSDFMITKSGQEVKISRIITSQAMKDVLPIYLPSVTIAGDVVSLIVQRPEQWVAWEAGLLGKVSRDGSDNPDILPNAVLDFGKGSEIRFINDDGKLTGIESLIYKTQELDDRFVNAGGDNMTGDLTINDKKVLTTGDYGHRDDDSGINADMLDGEHGSYYQDASNINKGKLDPARLSGTYNISILGNAATATNANYASRAGDADTLDKKPLSYFAPAGHTHAYVSKTGDTMTGPLVADVGASNVRIYKNLASYSYSGQFATGTLKITLPKSWTGTMMRIVIKGYDYSYETGAWEVIVGAYSYLGRNGWAGYSAEIRGNAPFSRVRLGHDGSKCVILLGDTSTKWRNLKAAVEEMLAGSSNVDGWETGWEISIITDESGITDIHTPALHDARNYVKKSGDTMTGNLTAPVLTAPEFRLNDSTKLVKGAADGSVRVRTGSRYVEIGMMSSSQARFSTDTASFYFNKPVVAAGQLQVYNKETYLAGTEGKIAGEKILTTGDYGHRSDGSGIDADKLDGKHASSFVEIDRFGATSTGGTLDWNHVSNTRPGTGYTLLMGNAANGPGPAVYFHAFNLEYASKDGTGNVTQFAIPYGNSSAIDAGIYYRGRYSGTWTAWKKLGSKDAIVAQNLSDRGYVQFSNGFIINWGTVGGGGAYAYFAKPFPHKCFIVVTGQFSRSDIWWDPGHATAAVNVTNSSFRNTGPDSAAYVAFGY